MNIKLITKAMHTLSLLSEDDVQMVMKLRGLSEDERQMLMLVLEPGTKPSKKSSKKSVGRGGGKSKHASSLQQQIQNAARGDSKPSPNQCIAIIDDNGSEMLCAKPVDDNVHHIQNQDNYHPFQPAEQAAVASGD